MHGSNINVFLKDKSYFDDASLMLRSFFTGSKVVYRGEIESDPEFGSVMEKNKYFYSFDDSLYCCLDAFLPEDEETLGKSKGEIHDIFKKALYESLMEYTDRKLPWGFLTGVRPSKRAMVLLNDAFDNKKEVINTLKERYLISDKKAELAYEVAKNERHIIDEVAGKDSISLYIHIPFCPSVCAYCSFATVISNNDLTERYVDKLCYELKAFKERLAHKKIDSIYMGGGTPTALTAEQLEKALVCVEENYDLSNLLEYTVEAGRADSITKEKLEVLKKHNISVKGKKCVVLGDGGASKAVVAVLKKMEAKKVVIVDIIKTASAITYEECFAKHTDAEFIANTSPVGMYPNCDASPVDLTRFPECEAVVDVIYNPLETKLVAQARELGMTGVNGLEMLVAQALYAVEFFLDTKLDEAKIDEVYHKIYEEKVGEQ